MSFTMWLPSAVATFGLMVLTAPAAAGPLRVQDSPTIVQLNESYGPPDASVVIPVDVKAPDGVHVGELQVQLTIPSALVALVRAVPSGLGEGAGVQMTVEAKRGQGADTSVLRIVMSGRLEGDTRQQIPNGQVAHLVFQIAKTTATGSVIALTPTVTGQTAGPRPAPVKPIEAPPSRIVVSSPAIISCFFYMH